MRKILCAFMFFVGIFALIGIAGSIERGNFASILYAIPVVFIIIIAIALGGLDHE